MGRSEPELERIAELLAGISNGQPCGTFLTATEVAELTGWRAYTLQIETLRAHGLPFFLNAAGKPVVPCTAIEGKTTSAAAKPARKPWEPPE